MEERQAAPLEPARDRHDETQVRLDELATCLGRVAREVWIVGFPRRGETLTEFDLFLRRE